jgi:RNA polymerase sigma-70 factor (ECF subfamily)
MAELPPTRPSLLIRIRDARDAEAWEQFVQVYAPLIYDYARRRGLQDADAADLAQDVLRAVATSAGRLEYDPARGTFRGWLFTVAHHKLHDLIARQRRPGRGQGDSAAQKLLEQQPARAEQDAWEQEYERRLFAWAAEQVRGNFEDSTWHAFWQTAVEGKSPRVVAESLGLTVGAVYIAKSRVQARLKQRIEEVCGE